MQYFISEISDDRVYRLNEEENELELYCGDGIWELKAGMYLDYRTGYHSMVLDISEKQARRIMKEIDSVY